MPVGGGERQAVLDEVHLQIRKMCAGPMFLWAADLPSGRPEPDGIAADDGCAETGFGRAHHSVTLLWVLGRIVKIGAYADFGAFSR
jgi:hypothetical protein